VSALPGWLQANLGLYVRSGRGRFACPLCGVQLRGRHRWCDWLLMPSVAIITVTAITLCTAPYVGILGGGLTALALGFLVVFSFDRYLESRFGILVIDS
jgi:hypothetical protein